MSDLRVIGAISAVETFAEGKSIRELSRLIKAYGPARWRKCKGVANVELAGGAIRRVEVHWYEAHGIGRIELKIKRYLE